jgi:hypothetical protein
MAEIMAVLESGLPRIFAALLLKFLDRNLLIGLGDNRVSAEHGGLPTSDGHDDRLGYASTAQSARSASPKIVYDLAHVTKATTDDGKKSYAGGPNKKQRIIRAAAALQSGPLEPRTHG